MKTLLKENNDKNRWYPTAIDTYKMIIKLDKKQVGSNELKKNISYNLQYLEYIEKQLSELRPSSVLICMLCKTYVITGMGIIEGLLSNSIKAKGLWNTDTWVSTSVFTSNSIKIDGKERRVKTEIFELVDKFEMRMDLDSMIKKAEGKKLYNIEHDIYPVLKRLRKLRNQVHLQQSTGTLDTDYYNFSITEKKEMGAILHKFLTDKEFLENEENSSIYDFLIK